MLQQLAAGTEAEGWAIGSMIFFFLFFLIVLYRVVTAKREEHDAFARIPLEDDRNPDNTASTDADQLNELRA